MIREVATRKGSSGFKGLLLIIAIALAVILMSSLVGVIENKLGIENLEYVIYVVLLAFAFYVIQHFITQYRYSLFDDELILEKMLGKKVTPVANIFIWEILSFEKANASQKIKTVKSHKLYVSKSNRWSLTYKKETELYEVIFSPSDEFASQLLNAIENRQHKQEREPNIVT